VKKTLARSLTDEPEARAALAREASFLSLASHPSIPRLVQVGKDERGPFIVEEAMLGRTLAEVSASWDPLVPRTLALHVAREAARALYEIHHLKDARGPLRLVHGDPSADNVILSPDARVRFVDFGESSHRDAEPRSVTQSGTAPYAAPELLRGEAAPSVATDIYALAAVLIAFATGVPLRPEREEAVRLVRLAEEGIDVTALRASSLPKSVAVELEKLVAFEPRNRNDDLEPLLEALDRC
jgi:serine/threonine-protein kinase